jgi:hypothetical protein
MKKIYNLIALFLFTISIVHATPQVTGFSVGNTYLQSGKIKVYDAGPTEFRANISASRSMNGSVYESVIMQVVFYITSSGTQHTLKTITLNSSHFNGAYLAYYNETVGNPPAANNVVKISIPANINHGRVAVKYRWKDSNGDWQPVINGGDEYTNLNNYGYDTINLTPPPPVADTILRSIHEYWSNTYTDHYYTNVLASTVGGGFWTYEKVAFHAFLSQVPNTVPIYEYMSETYGDHYYTTVNAPTVGGGSWVQSKIAFYAYTSPGAGRIPIYEYMSNTHGDHYYTTVDALTMGDGTWVKEKIAFYAVSPN